MSTVKAWRTTAAHVEYPAVPDRGKCTKLDGWGWPCLHGAAWVLTWTVNTSGLPHAGTGHTDFVCHAHLDPSVSYTTAIQASHVTITRYEESPA